MFTLKMWMQKLFNRRQRYGQMALAKGAAHGRMVTKPEIVFVRSGRVWLSAEPGMRLDGSANTGDRVLDAGECLEFSGSGRAVVQALTDSELELAPVTEAACVAPAEEIPHAALLRTAPMLR